MFTDSKSLEAALSLGWTDAGNPLLALLAIPVLGLAVNVFLQVALLRIAGGKGFMKTIALGFFLGGLGTLAAYPLWRWFQQGTSVADSVLEWAVLIAPTYAGLGYGYANFTNLGNSSIRIRLYEELRLAPAGLPLEEIRRNYNESAILKTRLQRLQESGDLTRNELIWRVARKRFVLLGGAIFFAKQLVLQKRSEFDSPTPL
jgi:hypothetical protein